LSRPPVRMVIIALLVSLTWLVPLSGLEMNFLQTGQDVSPYTPTVPALVELDPIDIGTNFDFVASGWNGSGTPDDPYLLEGVMIQSYDSCLTIRNTTAYFLVRSCVFMGTSVHSAVMLENVTNGRIENCTVAYAEVGIRALHCMNMSLTGNSVYSLLGTGLVVTDSADVTVARNDTRGAFFTGASVEASKNVTFESNSVRNCRLSGILLSSSTAIGIRNNTITDCFKGVEIDSCSGCSLERNTLVENGIVVRGTTPAHYEHKIGVDNVVNGKPVGYFIRHNNSVVDVSEYGQIIVVASRLLTVRGGEFFNAGEGVRVAFCEGVTIDSPVVHGGEAGLLGAWSSNCTVVGGEFSRALEAGIMLFGCSEWNVFNNNVTGNLGGGILLHNSSSNTLVGNAVLLNDAGGLFIQANSSGNLLYGNLFGWNGIPNAWDDGVRNHWNTTGAGNYWSDCTGSTYSIPGDAGSVDYHAMPVYETRVENGNIVPVTTSVSSVIYGGIVAAVVAVVVFLVLKRRRSL